jgi:hypothetical protein
VKTPEKCVENKQDDKDCQQINCGQSIVITIKQCN